MKNARRPIAGLALFLAVAGIPLMAPAEEFQAQHIGRLFISPQGRVLESMEVLLTLGGAYGSMNRGEYLGRASLGLGDFAQLEISTWRMVSNLINGTTSLGTTSMAVGLIQQQEGMIWPDLSLSFHINPSWKKLEMLHSDLTDELAGDVNEMHFETHFASLYASVSKKLPAGFSIHGGAFLTDMRTRDGEADLIGTGIVAFGDLRQDLIGGYGGLERQLNPRTLLIAEIASVPRFKYQPAANKMEIDQVVMFIGGVRFFFARRISTDAGIKYRSDYAGIADSEITVGLNVGLNLQDVFNEIMKR